MSRKVIYLITFILFIAGGVYLVSETIELAKFKRTLNVNSEKPEITFLTLKKDSVSLSTFTDSNHVFLHFSVSCPHCQSEFKEFNEHPAVMDSIQLVFISQNNITEIKEFADAHPFVKEKAVILHDSENNFLKGFGSSIVPNAFAYKNGKLVKNIRGVFDLHALRILYK